MMLSVLVKGVCMNYISHFTTRRIERTMTDTQISPELVTAFALSYIICFLIGYLLGKG